MAVPRACRRGCCLIDHGHGAIGVAMIIRYAMERGDGVAMAASQNDQEITKSESE